MKDRPRERLVRSISAEDRRPVLDRVRCSRKTKQRTIDFGDGPPPPRHDFAITAEEYDEIPELTDEMMARAVPGDGMALLKCGRGRPPSDSPKRQVTLRLDGDLVEAMRASGPGWQTRANDALRERFKA